MSPDPEKAELERERRELRQIRAELERRVAELDKRQSKAAVAERRGSMGKTEGSGGASPFRAERGFSQQSSSDLDRSLMQVHPFNTSVVLVHYRFYGKKAKFLYIICNANVIVYNILHMFASHGGSVLCVSVRLLAQ